MHRGTVHLAGILVALILVSVSASADIPLMINHQGMVKVNGVPYTGQGLFKFGFYEATGLTWLWTNDGYQLGLAISQAPVNALTLDVVNGHYSIRLGDTALGANMKAIPSSVFNADNVLLRVYFDDGVNGEQPLLPDQPVTSGAYAFHAYTADTVPGHIDGGVLSNDTTDPTNSLHITDLICRDDQNTANIEVAAMSKRVDANWAAGHDYGGLDTGIVGTSQALIHVFVIGDSTGENAGDILLSKSGTSPTLPSGYDLKRFVGARLWDGAQWWPFYSAGTGRARWTHYGLDADAYPFVGSLSQNKVWEEFDLSSLVAAGRTHAVGLMGNAERTGAEEFQRAFFHFALELDQRVTFLQGFTGHETGTIKQNVQTAWVPLDENATLAAYVSWDADTVVLRDGVAALQLMSFREDL